MNRRKEISVIPGGGGGGGGGGTGGVGGAGGGRYQGSHGPPPNQMFQSPRPGQGDPRMNPQYGQQRGQYGAPGAPGQPRQGPPGQQGQQRGMQGYGGGQGGPPGQSGMPGRSGGTRPTPPPAANQKRSENNSNVRFDNRSVAIAPAGYGGHGGGPGQTGQSGGSGLKSVEGRRPTRFEKGKDYVVQQSYGYATPNELTFHDQFAPSGLSHDWFPDPHGQGYWDHQHPEIDSRVPMYDGHGHYGAPGHQIGNYGGIRLEQRSFRRPASNDRNQPAFASSMKSQHGGNRIQTPESLGSTRSTEREIHNSSSLYVNTSENHPDECPRDTTHSRKKYW